MQFIVFNAIKTNLKIPRSPYNDNTFNFTPLTVKNLTEAFKILANNHTLTHNLNISKTLRFSRKKKDLKPLLALQNYLILDIDCKTRCDVNKVLDYFKSYKCILGESRTFKESHYGIKGVLKIQQSNDIEFYRVFKKIQNDIKDFGYLDNQILNVFHFIYPIEKLKVLQESNGVVYPHSIARIPDPNPPGISTESLKSDDYEDMCLEYFKNLGFRKVASGEYEYNKKTYKLLKPYLMISYSDTVNIYDNIEAIQSQKIQNFIKDYTPDLTIDCKFLTDSNLNLKDIFKKYDTLALKSFMGSKKSEIIKQIIQTKSKVLVVTSRISLALEYNDKFKIPVYLNVNFKKTDDFYKIPYRRGDSLICQYDSLHKINPRDFDYVVMDEYVSILLHSIDNLSNLKKENLTKFRLLFKKKLIISDAFLNDYLLNEFKNIYKIENRQKISCNLIEHINLTDFLESIEKAIMTERITISTNSVNFIHNKILQMSSSRDKNILIIQGQTQSSKKEEYFKELNSHYLNYDIIIYSPAVTVGVSIFNGIKKHYHYDGSNSIDTVQSVQMVGRGRLVENIEYFIQDRHQYMRLGKENEKWEIENRHKNKDNSFYFELDDNGDLKLSELGEFYLKIKTFLRFLKFDSRSSFDLLLRCNFKV